MTNSRKVQFAFDAFRLYFFAEFAAYMLGRKIGSRVVRRTGRFFVKKTLRSNHGR